MNELLSTFHGTNHRNLNLLNVRGKQGKCGECCRTDGKSLSGSCCGISKRVECIGSVTNFLTQFAHLSVTSGIVGNGAVSVGGKRDAKCRKHTNGSNTNTIKTMGDAFCTHGEVESVCTHVTEQDGNADCQYRNAC